MSVQRYLLTETDLRPPVLLGSRKLGLIWSPKAACTTVLFWYFWQAGLLEEAYALDRFPHVYRIQKLQTNAYRRMVAELQPQEWTWVKVIRDPYLRAVSSYRHALGRGYEDAQLGSQGFSFQQFLDYLLRIDLDTANPHHSPQYHGIEDHVRPRTVINADRTDLLESLQALGASMGLPPAQIADKLDRLARTHHARIKPTDADCSQVVFVQAQARHTSEWPNPEAFLNPATRERIQRIYARDFTAYADFL